MSTILPKPGISQSTLDDWDHYCSCFAHIASEFSVSEVDNQRIGEFFTLAAHDSAVHLSTAEVSQSGSSFRLCLIEYEYNWVSASRSGGGRQREVHLHFFGHLHLKQDHGVALIRPETMKDKINEWVDPVEIDVASHPKFSRNYYVVAQNKEQFQPFLTPELMELLQTIKGLQLEFRNKECIFRLPKPMDKAESLELCRIGLQLNRMLNKTAVTFFS